MARTSLAGARADVYTALSGVTGFTHTYDHEPVSHGKPAALTVSTAGMTPTEYLIAVRLYVSAETNPEDAQDRLDTLIQATDDALPSWAGPSQWDVSFELGDESGGAQFVAVNVLQIGREDGF